jgi:hypothetical protein
MGTSGTTTLAQDIALALAPKVGGSISILGSTWIALDVMGSTEKRSAVYHRMMLGISCFDVLVSTGALASTWPMTTSSEATENDDVYYDSPWQAHGNDVTCSIQGFAMQLGSTLFCYNAALSIFYVLMIAYRVPEFKLKKYEWALHGPPVLFGMTTATVAAILGWYHNANLWCWMAESPECLDPQNTDSPSCDKYEHIWIYRWALFFAPLWACFVIQVSVAHTHTHTQEKRVKMLLWSLFFGKSHLSKRIYIP